MLSEVEEGDERYSESYEGAQSPPRANTTAQFVPYHSYHAQSTRLFWFFFGGHADHILLRHTASPAPPMHESDANPGGEKANSIDAYHCT